MSEEPPALVQTAPPRGYYPDPYGRFPLRWWNGTQWTATVRDQRDGPSRRDRQSLAWPPATEQSTVVATEPETTSVTPPTRSRIVLTFLWALLPLLTFGAFTWAVIGFAAMRKRSRQIGVAAGAYLGLVIAESALAPSMWYLVPFLIAWLGGTAHALVIRRVVFDLPDRESTKVQPSPYPAASALPVAVTPPVTTPVTPPVVSPITPAPTTPKPRRQVTADDVARVRPLLYPDPQGRPLYKQAAAAPRASRTGSGCLILVAVVVVIAVIITAIVYATGGGTDGPSREGAIAACEHFVGQQLKAPGSADYSDWSNDTVTHGGNFYTVSGYVDAQNSFGAKLRESYTCTVSYTGSGWRLEYLSGLQ